MRSGSVIKILVFFVLISISCTSFKENVSSVTDEQLNFLNDLKQRNFYYFWDILDTNTWQNDDRYPSRNFSSIAATGFALTSYIIGSENGYITRQQSYERVEKVLQWLWKSEQGQAAEGITGYKGFYYHFLNYKSGTRYKEVELSTIDTGLLMAGILACQSYFDSNTDEEKALRALADSLYLRVEWDWAMNGGTTMSMGWTPEKGFINSTWTGYNEAMVMLIMALGSPSHTLKVESWDEWCRTYNWAEYYGYNHINFSPLFGHQYSHMFVDFRGINDNYNRLKGTDYFENSKRATLSNRAYCIDNPMQFEGYSESIWGLSACDGPANALIEYNGKKVQFMEYSARGASKNHVVDDGTITPTAAGGSIPFAPEYCIDALYTMRTVFGEKLYQEYGFKDAFNMSFSEEGWFDKDYIGIDQGAILIQLENFQSGLIWNLMKKNKYIEDGLRKAGFKGGWLDKS